VFEVSVVIPLYNSESTITDVLESVRMQTELDCVKQVIVVDDGSSDGSYALVEQYALEHPELPIELYRQENRGASSARNEGMKRAGGNWIAFLDSDDEWLPHKLRRQRQVVEEHPQIDFLGAGHDAGDLKILWKRIDTLHKATVKELVLKYFPCTPTILMKKKIFDEIGGFDENLRYAEDGEYYTRICRQYNYYYLPEQLVEIGHGKRPFGERGLSGNLREMYRGNKLIISRLREAGDLSAPFYLFLRLFYWAKYLRRIAITLLYKMRTKNGNQ